MQNPGESFKNPFDYIIWVSGGQWIGRVVVRSLWSFITGKPGVMVRAFHSKLERRI